MKLETIFSIVNTVALVGWILLVVAPRWTWTRRLVINGGLPILLAIVYLTLIIAFWGGAEGDFFTLAGVSKLFSNPAVMLAAWVHYLVFDLFVGAWEVKDAQERNISHWFVLPCLFFTFLLGPIGFLLYHIVRFAAARKTMEEKA